MKDKLFHSITKGVVSIGSLRLALLLFNFISIFILARFLNSVDFGLIGIGLIAIATVQPFTEIGVTIALIQKQDDTEGFLDTAWTISIIQGFLVYTLLCLTTPWLVNLFQTPQIKFLIPTLGLLIPLNSFANIGIVYFSKELKFSKYSRYLFFSYLANFVITVLMVVILRNFWAIVFGLLAEKIALCCFSYSMHPYRPRFSIKMVKLKYLLNFGKWVFFSSVLFMLLTQVDNIIVGKFLGVAALGFYQMSFRISNILPKEIIDIVSKVLFPGFAKLQYNITQLRGLYLKALCLILVVTFLFTGEIIILAPELIKLFLGVKWIPVVPVLQIFCIFSILRVTLIITHQVFLAIGKPKIRTNMQIVQIFLLGIFIYPLFKTWGLTGVALAVTLSALSSCVVSLRIVAGILKIRINELIKLFMLLSMTIVVMGYVLFKIKFWWGYPLGMGKLCCVSLIGVGIYLLLILAFDLFFDCGIWRLGKDLFKPFYRKLCKKCS